MGRALLLLAVIAGCGRIAFDPRNDASADTGLGVTCSSGFVGVPGNAALGTQTFCAMQFEAKAWRDANGDQAIDTSEVDADGCDDACPVCDGTCALSWEDGSRLPAGTPYGVPWRNASALHARAMCAALGAGFDLMANREWMTIARNAELVGVNWSGGTPGVGRLVEGNTDGAVVFAVSDPGDPYTDTSNSAADPPDAGWEQRRTVVLASGIAIWDMPGNMQEWMDWTLGGSLDGPPTPCTSAELPAVACAGLLYDDFNSSTGTYDSTNGAGYFLGGMGDAGRRGGQVTDRSFGIAGIYALNVNRFTTQIFPATGFRCVFRPAL